MSSLFASQQYLKAWLVKVLSCDDQFAKSLERFSYFIFVLSSSSGIGIVIFFIVLFPLCMLHLVDNHK